MPVNFDFTPAPKARRLAFSAFLVTLLFCIASQLSITQNETTWSFSFIPCIVIFLWHKGTNGLLSLCLIFLLGLFQDQVSFGPLGLWPFIWISFFLLYRPDARRGNNDLLALWGGFIFWIGIIVGLHLLIGGAIIRQTPYVANLLLSGVTAIVVFPFVWGGRKILMRLVDADDELGIFS